MEKKLPAIKSKKDPLFSCIKVIIFDIKFISLIPKYLLKKTESSPEKSRPQNNLSYLLRKL